MNLVDDEPTSGELATQRRVMETAEDRPDTESLPALADPAADHLDPDLRRRRADVDEKHRRVVEFLERHGYHAALLGRADSVSWFTSGGDLREHLGSEFASVQLFINHRCRAILADNVQSPRAFEEEVAGLGFHLKERPWHEPAGPLVESLCRGRKIASDLAGPGLSTETDRLRELRLSLSKLERQRLRELGRTLTLCVEATCRNFEPGETEADLAGHLCHRLLREGVTPVALSVAGDDRPARYRRPAFKSAPIRSRAVIRATGRRHGLCASVTRIVSLGPVDPKVREAHGIAAMVDATAIYFSRPGQPVAEVFRRLRRIYEKFGHPHEWTLAYQGSVVGYAPTEFPLLPDSPFVIRENLPLNWSPSVGPAQSEDTVVVDARGFEVVTEAQRWPKLEIMVKGFSLPRPGILER
ncbi:M24 family metallopeptidase [Tautonia sociabilis]|uniref:M24 family metallopeptidase n=2 Tax=Tautonia sociabilis TaxID=2080755 RepID=A0A432MHM9_9BACT|nr:M24 family metallopeptidase [Tautonia sociabilis]